MEDRVWMYNLPRMCPEYIEKLCMFTEVASPHATKERKIIYFVLVLTVKRKSLG